MMISTPKVAWFTPFHNRSSIGKFSQAVTQQLATQAQVDLWVVDSGNLLNTSLRMVPYGNISHYENWLREYDYVVYNLADNVANHSRIYEASLRHRGIIILHDYVMQHFFVDYYRSTRQLQRYCDVMKRWYGIGDLHVSGAEWSGPWADVYLQEDVVNYPLFEEAIVGATGVIVHSDVLRNRVCAAATSPVAKIHLAHSVYRTSSTLSRTELGVPEGRLLLVTIGPLNQNKRIETTLRAIAADAVLKSRIYYMVVGASDSGYGQRMAELSEELGIQDVVRFSGYVEESVLRAALSHADICIDLRWPAMEGASDSIVWEMSFGKATVVIDTGVYHELPNDAVSKVSVEYELDDLSRSLRVLVSDETLRRSMGGAAMKFAAENFTPGKYAERFLDFCHEVSRYQPAFRLAELVAGELRAIGATTDMAIVDTIARQSAALLDGEWDPPILKNVSQPRSTDP